jgi:hypothetical protein
VKELTGEAFREIFHLFQKHGLAVKPPDRVPDADGGEPDGGTLDSANDITR